MYSPICIFFSLKRTTSFAIPKTVSFTPTAKREESKRWRISHTATPSSRFIYQFPESLRLQGCHASFSSIHSILHSTRRHSSGGRGEAGLVCNDWVLEFVCTVTLMRWTNSSLAHTWSTRSVESLPVSGLKGAGSWVCLFAYWILSAWVCVIMQRCLFTPHRRESSTKTECKHTAHHTTRSRWWVRGQRRTSPRGSCRWPTGWSRSLRTPDVQQTGFTWKVTHSSPKVR